MQDPLSYIIPVLHVQGAVLAGRFEAQRATARVAAGRDSLGAAIR